MDGQTCEKFADSVNDIHNDTQTCFSIRDGNQESFKIASGGPAVCDGKLHGIFSWDNRKWTCDKNEIVGVFTKLRHYNSWIRSNLPYY